MTERRTLGWATRDGTLVSVCDMSDTHLLATIQLITHRIMAAKMVSGITSVSILALEYMNAEAKDRGLTTVGSGDSEADTGNSA